MPPLGQSLLSFESILFEEIEEFTQSGLPIIYQSFQLESIVKIKLKNTYWNANFTFLDTRWPTIDELTTMKANGINGLGIWKNRIVEVDTENRVTSVRRDKLQEVQSYGIENIHVYTFRNENKYIAFDFEQDYSQELEFWWKNIPEVNGYFCDFPKSVVRAWKNFENSC